MIMALALLCLVYYLPQHRVLAVDSLLAWPITDSIAHPGRYGNEDLIVRAGATGNFLLYKLMAHFPLLPDNLPLRDAIIYIPIFFLYLLAWYDLFYTLCKERVMSFVAVLFLLFSDAKLGLNWSNAPIPFFISVTSVQFAQVFGFSLFLKRYRKTSLAVIALSGYLHPASALVLATVLCSLVAVNAIRDKSPRLLAPVFLFAAIFLPNVLMIAMNSQGALRVTDEYFRVFSLFQYHVYLEDHFREGYAYTLSLIALLVVCLRNGLLTVHHERHLIAFLLFSVTYSALWLVNVYTLQNLQAIQTYFIMRIFYFVKPVLILLTLMTYCRLSAGRPLREQLFLLLLPLTILGGAPTVSLIIVFGITCYLGNRAAGLMVVTFLVGMYGCYLGESGFDHWQILTQFVRVPQSNTFVHVDLVLFGFYLLLALPCALVATHTGGRGSEGEYYVNAGRAVLLLSGILLVGALVPSRAYSLYEVFAKEGGAWFIPCKETNYGLAGRNPDYHDLLLWAGQSHGKTYVVPPYELEFASFRYLSGNGVYVHQYDINQLMYSPAYYLPAYERLLKLGLVPEGGRKYRWKWRYAHLSMRELSETSADFVIFRRPAPPEIESSNVRAVFKNASYVVYSLSELRQAAGVAPVVGNRTRTAE